MASGYKSAVPKIGKGRTFIGNYMEHLSTSAAQTAPRSVSLYGTKWTCETLLLVFAGLRNCMM